MKKFTFQISILVFFIGTSALFAQKVFYKEKYYTLKNDKIYQRGKIVTKGLNNGQRDSIYTIAKELYDERGKLKPEYRKRKVRDRYKAPENFWEDRAEKMAAANGAVSKSAVVENKTVESTTAVANNDIAKAEESSAAETEHKDENNARALKDENAKSKISEAKQAEKKTKKDENLVAKAKRDTKGAEKEEQSKREKEIRNKEKEQRKIAKEHKKQKAKEQREDKREKDKIADEKAKAQKEKRKADEKQEKALAKADKKENEREKEIRKKEKTAKKLEEKEKTKRKKQQVKAEAKTDKKQDKREKEIRKKEKEQRKAAKENKKTAKQLKKKEKALKNLEKATEALATAQALSKDEKAFGTVYFKINKEKTKVDSLGFIKLYFDLINNSNKEIIVLKPDNSIDRRINFFTTKMECLQIVDSVTAYEAKHIKIKDEDYITVVPNSKSEFFIDGVYQEMLACSSEEVVLKIEYNPFRYAEKGIPLSADEQKDFRKALNKISKQKIESENIKFKLRK